MLIHGTECQLTHGAINHILTNANVWSSDGRWIYYDVRSDAAGEVFDGQRIERVHVHSGRTEVIYQSRGEGCVGVVTASPTAEEVIFIHGPDHPTEDWKYGAWHRRGVIAQIGRIATAFNMDARDLTPPFTAGALRGGSHVHTFSPDGKWIAFTYEDHVLAEFAGNQEHELNQRAVGVSVPADFMPGGSVVVDASHPRNHSGSFFSVLVTRTYDRPAPGSDQICRAFEDAWIGQNGYIRSDGKRQRRAIAFQGEVVTAAGPHREVFAVDLPELLTHANSLPLAGTPTTRPNPPLGAVQRRLTRTSHRKYPGIQGPRHWLRSSPDGTMIACLMRDDAGVIQIWTVSPSTGETRQLTRNAHDISSAFTWSGDGNWIAHAMDTSICVTDVGSGETFRLTAAACPESSAPRPEACVFSPSGDQIAYVRRVPGTDRESRSLLTNQIFVLSLT